MGASPAWKVYDSSGVYEASCKNVETAAAIVSFLGEGSTIRYEHGRPLWVEGEAVGRYGKGDGSAGESYDHVAEVVGRRLQEEQRRYYDKTHGPGAADRVLKERARKEAAP